MELQAPARTPTVITPTGAPALGSVAASCGPARNQIRGFKSVPLYFTDRCQHRSIAGLPGAEREDGNALIQRQRPGSFLV